jgi:hypothetical protein
VSGWSSPRTRRRARVSSSSSRAAWYSPAARRLTARLLAAVRVSGWSSPRSRRRRARVSSSSCTWALPSSPAIPALSPRRRVRAKLPPSTSCSACERLWLQPRRRDADSRPSAFQAGHIPSWRKSCESYALSAVADDSGWLLLLLSPLLSAVGAVLRFRAVSPLMTASRPGPPCHLPATQPSPVLAQAPPPNPIAAEPYGRRVLSGGGEADHE